MSRTLKLAAAFAIAAAILSPSALAQSPDASIRVAYGDLDLSKADDGAKLLRRIETAAQQVCEKVTARWTIIPRAEINCRVATVRHAVESAKISTLTQAWAHDRPPSQIASR
jgi:UrcA family protein